MNSPTDDKANRRPVWKVMSGLFLDTELQPGDHEDIVIREDWEKIKRLIKK